MTNGLQIKVAGTDFHATATQLLLPTSVPASYIGLYGIPSNALINYAPGGAPAQNYNYGAPIVGSHFITLGYNGTNYNGIVTPFNEPTLLNLTLISVARVSATPNSDASSSILMGDYYGGGINLQIGSGTSGAPYNKIRMFNQSSAANTTLLPMPSSGVAFRTYAGIISTTGLFQAAYDLTAALPTGSPPQSSFSAITVEQGIGAGNSGRIFNIGFDSTVSSSNCAATNDQMVAMIFPGALTAADLTIVENFCSGYCALFGENV